MKNRWHNHMSSNGYLDHNIQKAFMSSVLGCIEHYSKLVAAIHEAQNKHKSLSVCWLDIANAFGSIHHHLISFSLQDYNAPEQLVSLINHLYSGLSAAVVSWSTPAIPFSKGVFQGDPLSAEIFNTVMNTYWQHQTSVTQHQLQILKLSTFSWSLAVCWWHLPGHQWLSKLLWDASTDWELVEIVRPTCKGV